MFKKLVLCLISCLLIKKGASVNLVAYVSQYGLHGEFHFKQISEKDIEIESFLETTLEYPEQTWSWGINQFPVDYTNADPNSRCKTSNLGRQIQDFDESFGYLTLPDNATTKWEMELQLTGENGIWGKSIVLQSPESGFKICATITTKDLSLEHIAEARFNAPIAGSVYFRWLAAKNTGQTETLIYSNLYHLNSVGENTDGLPFTQNPWKIYITDIFDSNNDRSDEDCNNLQLVFDPQDKGTNKGLGDLDKRIGNIAVARDIMDQDARVLFRDSELFLLPTDLTGPKRKLYLVIFDSVYTDTFISCSKIRPVEPRVVKSIINGKGIKGELTLAQRSRFEPTWLNFSMSSTRDKSDQNIEYAQNVASFKITELPPNPVHANKEHYCETGNLVFNPFKIESRIPPPGYGTQDQYPIGDLSGKLQSRNKFEKHNYYLPGASSELSGLYWDVFLPLEGLNSVVHRGYSLQRYNRTDPANITESKWSCGVLSLYQKNEIYQVPMFTGQVLFRYPIVGRILLRQPQEEPWADTTLIIEYLIHADGAALNNSDSHRWAIHLEPPGLDFYNWSERCVSSRQVFNPYKVEFDKKAPEDKCKPSDSHLCRLGDLWNRLGTLTIAGSKKHIAISRKMFNVPNLPLHGPNNVLGKSLVIYDDFGPKARGERLACSIIGSHHRRKTVARNWFANGVPLTVNGRLEMVQASEYDITNVDFKVDGLDENSGYHVHITPVEGDLTFPCEDSTLHGHWNPRKVDPTMSPKPGTGSTDEYEMGDLSGKFGTLDGLSKVDIHYNDTNLPLFGYESVIGRSILIHKKAKNFRWACSSLERGYSPSEARELRAIASFHHPAGFAWGYIRMTQLIGSDGSPSDTVIEVNLRHPGTNDRNQTKNHEWQIFVNGVGIDATVPQTATRCVAGGYIWNPFYTQLADPLNGDLYRAECGSDNPLRCYVGDVSSRVGTLDMGRESRSVYSDPNFPLETPVSALGRSIVIFGPERSGERYACANIEPDHDIVKDVNIQKPPRFVIAQFLADVREVMGVPDWMLSIDSRSTKTRDEGECILIVIHFKGPQAHKFDQDFSRLMMTGKLEEPSIYIAGYINQKRKTKLSYRQCSGVKDRDDKRKMNEAKAGASGLNLLPILIFIPFILQYFISATCY